MKTSSNTIGMLIFAALATAVFVLMVLRPAVEGNAMNLGIPLNVETTASTESSEATTEIVPATTTEEKEATENAGEISTDTTKPEASEPTEADQTKPTEEAAEVTEPAMEEKTATE
ncbi:MAG: hypothetical protein ACI88H_004062 [Cocleimonas sp.]|jgi:hypothetical protein